MGPGSKRPLAGFGALVVALLAGCAQTTQPRSFDPAGLAGTAMRGSASVAGTAVMTTPNGLPVSCAGSTVTLIPDTPFTAAFVDDLVHYQVDTATTDPRLERYTRLVPCDMAGRFRFTGLPAGRWFAVAQIDFRSPNGNVDGVFAVAVDTAPGELSEVAITGNGRAR